MMCAHPILPLFQATQAIAATIATTIIIIVDSIFFVNMSALAPESRVICDFEGSGDLAYNSKSLLEASPNDSAPMQRNYYKKLYIG